MPTRGLVEAEPALDTRSFLLLNEEEDDGTKDRVLIPFLENTGYVLGRIPVVGGIIEGLIRGRLQNSKGPNIVVSFSPLEVKQVIQEALPEVKSLLNEVLGPYSNPPKGLFASTARFASSYVLNAGLDYISGFLPTFLGGKPTDQTNRNLVGTSKSTPVKPVKQAIKEEKAAKAKKIADAKKAMKTAKAREAAEAKKLADAKKAASARKIAEAKQAAKALKIANAMKIAEAKKAAKEQKAAEAREAARAKKAAKEQKAAEAKRIAREKKAAKEQKAAEAKEAARAKKAAKEQKAAEAKEAAEAKKSGKNSGSIFKSATRFVSRALSSLTSFF
ncbi:hypothetical protein K7432_017838 [Basidiobolus ranarum]|uniref:Uncharacterized protein n=1 Tax=Basidiobolus ranarum TaxID=34480 RepID=A0ABR2VJT9_9FUNG